MLDLQPGSNCTAQQIRSSCLHIQLHLPTANIHHFPWVFFAARLMTVATVAYTRRPEYPHSRQPKNTTRDNMQHGTWHGMALYFQLCWCSSSLKLWHTRALIKSYNVNKLLRQFSQYQIFYLQMKSSEFNNISEENPKCCIQIARGIRRSQCSLAHTHTHTMYSICRYIWQIRFAQNVSASTQNGCQRRKLFPAFRIHTHLPSNVCLGTWASSAALHWWPTTYPCVMQPMKESFWQWQIRTSYSYKTKSASHCIHLLSFCSADAKVARFCLALNEFARN